MVSNPVPSSELRLTVNETSADAIVQCSGRITSDSSESLERTVKPLFSAGKFIVLDLSNVSYLPITMIDATGLYTVEEIVDMLKQQGVVLAAVGRQTEGCLWAKARHRDPQYSKVSLYPTFREAIRMFRRAQGIAGDSEEVSEPI